LRIDVSARLAADARHSVVRGAEVLARPQAHTPYRDGACTEPVDLRLSSSAAALRARRSHVSAIEAIIAR